MVFKNITRIKSALPEVLHVVMFYNTGTIFQTTFEQEINIPKLGVHLAEVLNHMRKLYDICQIHVEKYEKIIFETENVSIMILQLGEDSNLALFFKQEEDEVLRINKVRRYLTRIEELIDMDKKELIVQEIIAKEEQLKDLYNKLENLKDISEDKETIYNSLQSSVEKLKEEIYNLKAKIEKQN